MKLQKPTFIELIKEVFGPQHRSETFRYTGFYRLIDLKHIVTLWQWVFIRKLCGQWDILNRIENTPSHK